MFAPDTTASIWAWVRLGIFLPLLWFVPGWLIARGARSPLPVITAFLTSLLLWFYAVLALDVAGIRLSLASLASCLGFAGIAGWVVSRLAGVPAPRWPRPTGRIHLDWREWWWVLPCAIGFGSVVVRALIDPLEGFDNIFRWNHLALVMQGQGSLAHYPPVTAADFRVYPWCDGIPPLVPIMNLAVYLTAGGTVPALTAARIMAELACTIGLVWHLAGKLWGGRGARVALLALSGSSLFLWSVGMGQETATSGVAVLMMAALALAYRESPERSTAVWLGVAAGMAGLCRDYNLLFVPLAGVVLRLCGGSWRRAALTVVVGAVVTAPWYLRNALLTGNPLFSHDILGLFPINTAQAVVMDFVRQHQGSPIGIKLLKLIPAFAVGLGLSLPLALFAGWKHFRELAALLLLIGANTGLYVAAISSTGGGDAYGMRVLGTGLPLLAVIAGGSTLALSKRWFAVLVTGLALVVVDATWRSYVFVWNPLIRPEPFNWEEWKIKQTFRAELLKPELWTALRDVSAGDAVIFDHPAQLVLARDAGVNAISLFSPEAGALTRPSKNDDLRAMIETLREQRVRYIVTTVWSTPPQPLPLPGLLLLDQQPAVLVEPNLKVYDLNLLLKITSSNPTPETNALPPPE